MPQQLKCHIVGVILTVMNNRGKRVTSPLFFLKDLGQVPVLPSGCGADFCHECSNGAGLLCVHLLFAELCQLLLWTQGTGANSPHTPVCCTLSVTLAFMVSYPPIQVFVSPLFSVRHWKFTVFAVRTSDTNTKKKVSAGVINRVTSHSSNSIPWVAPQAIAGSIECF